MQTLLLFRGFMAAVHPSEYRHGASYPRNLRQHFNERESLSDHPCEPPADVNTYLNHLFKHRLYNHETPITPMISSDCRPSCHGLRKRGNAGFDDRIYYVETILFPERPIAEPLQYEDVLPPVEMIPLLLRSNRDWLFDIYVRRNLGIAWRDTPPYHRQRYEEFRQTFSQAIALKKPL